MIILGILLLILIVSGLFINILAKDVITNKNEVIADPIPGIPLAISSFFIFFLSTFGVSDFAISTVIYRKLDWVSDKKLPGTLNAQGVIPLAVMSFAYITSIEVDVLTLLLLITAQVMGAYIGPRFVVKLPGDTIRKFVGSGLVLATLVILANNLNLVPSGGVATSLRGYKLLVGVLALFTFGALNNIGIGSFALTMVTVHALGLNPSVAFPIMVGAAAFSISVGSMQFIKFKQYSRKITLYCSLFGVIGVIFAVSIVKNLDLAMLQWLVAIVLAYTGVDMLLEEVKHKRVSM